MSFLFNLSDTKKVFQEACIFMMTYILDSLNVLRLIPFMCKFQWLMNNTFYLVTGKLPRCFKTGKLIWILLFPLLLFLLTCIFLSHLSFFSHANTWLILSVNIHWDEQLYGRLSDLNWENVDNIKRTSMSLFGAWHPFQKVSNLNLCLEICSCYFLCLLHVSVNWDICSWKNRQRNYELVFSWNEY